MKNIPYFRSSPNTQALSCNDIDPQLNDNLQLLLNCCKTNPNDEDIDFIISCIVPFQNALEVQHSHYNIQSLITLSSSHGILPIVYKTLKSLSKSNPSLKKILSEIKPLYMSIVQRNMLMTSELIRIMQILEANNIHALAFKGPTLAQMAYGDITLRQYSDLDILVDEKDLFNAGKIISASSYAPDVELEYLNNQTLLEISNDLGFHHSSNNTYIELHWKLFQKKLSTTLDKHTFTSNPTVVNIQGNRIKTLQTDLLLVYLCRHGSKHMWERIEWITDIDRLICQCNTIDWNAVWHYSQTMKSINTLLLGLSLSKELFNTPFPDTIITEINKRHKIEHLKTHTLTRINQTLSKQNSGITAMLQQFAYHAKLYDSFGDKVKYYISSIFKVTRADILNVNLPRYLSFLYIIIRPFRLANKYLTRN